MMQSEQINDLAAALAKAQADIKGAAKDKENPHFKSRYADLAAVWDACRGPLTKNGLSVVQTSDVADDGKILMRTALLHISGQWIEGVLPCMADRQGMQPLGSAITYARRYGLAAIVGIAPEDDDGEGATDHKKSARAPTAPKTVSRGKPNGKPSSAPDGLIAVPMLNDEPDWNTWCNRFIQMYADAKDPNAFKELHRQTLTNLKHSDEPLFDRLCETIKGDAEAAPA